MYKLSTKNKRSYYKVSKLKSKTSLGNKLNKKFSPYQKKYHFRGILFGNIDQPQIFEKKPYKNYYFLVSYACVEPFL